LKYVKINKEQEKVFLINFTVVLNDNLNDKLYIPVKDELTKEDIELINLLCELQGDIISWRMGV
jgi:hypothetical protein